ncbi:unnamed protein product [Macrosiphum euphorbiae]|uniref:Uncharacterized protein n=1 Tax=Macrosiphum euphorbiae TaxID=13131 RepID=A0AAV0Y0I9_9HEMI|nr:unnamed protein product [Macrosiphum euphorbiae]
MTTKSHTVIDPVGSREPGPKSRSEGRQRQNSKEQVKDCNTRQSSGRTHKGLSTVTPEKTPGPYTRRWNATWRSRKGPHNDQNRTRLPDRTKVAGKINTATTHQSGRKRSTKYQQYKERGETNISQDNMDFTSKAGKPKKPVRGIPGTEQHRGFPKHNNGFFQ